MASERSVLVRLQASITDFKAAMQQAERSVKGVGDQSEKSSYQATTTLGRMTQSAQKNRESWDDAGKALAGFGAVTVVALGATIKAAIDWESAWAGVGKTVEGNAQQMATLEGELRGLARVLPSTQGEIAAVAEAAGQLGIQRENIAAFTKTMIDLGQSTSLSADEAATSIAQMMNVMQTAPDDVGRLGASLVALGNAGASTEAEIMNMASYITGSAKLIGASESDVLALANAMVSMGINAERGGGVMTRTMQDIYTAVQSGGDQLENFAKVAGMSSAEFARAFEADPVRAIDSFIQGLNGVKSSGGNVVEVLSELGIKGTQDTAVLLQMMGAGNLLTESLNLGAKAWEENTALTDEAGKRYDTTAAKLAMARNGIVDAAISIGETFLPVLADLASVVADAAGWFADLPEPIQLAVGGLAGVAGVAALAGGAFLLLFPRVIETVTAFRTLNTAHPGVASGLSSVGKAAGIAGAAFAGLQMITSAFSESSDELARFAAKAQALGGPDVEGQIKSLTEEIARQQAIVDDAAISWEFWGTGIFSNDASKDAFNRVEALTEQLEVLEHQKELDAIASEKAAEASGGMASAAGAVGESTAVLAQDLVATYGSIEGYAAALGLSEDATKELITRTSELGQSLAGFVDPLGTYTGYLDAKIAKEQEASGQTDATGQAGQESWRQFAEGAGISIAEYLADLEEQLAAQENWQVNMLMLAGRVSQGTLDELARMGPEGAPLVADLVNASDAELDRFDDITALRSKEATDAWGAQLTMAAPVLAAIGRTAGSGVVAELAAQLRAGTTTVADIARQYGVNLAGGINPVLTSLGKRPIAGVGGRLGGLMEADGGIVDYYANGGVRENHVAQIAPAGAWRMWAEPETGGESYIPLSPTKRARSTDIWEETGRLLGIDFETYADGGFSGPSAVPRPRSTAPYQPPISTAGDAAMEAAYEAATEWLQANVPSMTLPGGPAPATGGGNVGGGWQGMFAAVRAAFPRVKLNSGFRAGDPGYHGRGRAIDIGESGFPGGSGRPYIAAMNRWIHDTYGARSAELIYSGLGDDRPDLKNGRPLNYGAATNAQHRNHVHWAMAKGGILNPHVRDAGGPLLPGYTFNGTGGMEDVVPRHVRDAGAVAPTVVVAAPSLNGLEVTGRLVMEPDGFVRLVDGRIAQHNAVDGRNLRSAL